MVPEKREGREEREREQREREKDRVTRVLTFEGEEKRSHLAIMIQWLIQTGAVELGLRGSVGLNSQAVDQI